MIYDLQMWLRRRLSSNHKLVPSETGGKKVINHKSDCVGNPLSLGLRWLCMNFFALSNFELDHLTFIECCIAGRFVLRVVDEQVNEIIGKISVV